MFSHLPPLLAMIEKPKTEVNTDNRLPHSLLSGKVSHSSFRDRRALQSRNSLTMWIWQYEKRTDDNKILNCVRKLMKNKLEKEVGKGPNLLKNLTDSMS
jgi:hypothetical protein